MTEVSCVNGHCTWSLIYNKLTGSTVLSAIETVRLPQFA